MVSFTFVFIYETDFFSTMMLLEPKTRSRAGEKESENYFFVHLVELFHQKKKLD